MRIAVLFLVLAALLPLPARGAEYAAVLMAASGPTAEYAEGTLAGTPIEVMEFINPNETIRVPAGTTLTLQYFSTSQQEQISGPAKFVVEQGHSRLIEGAPIVRDKVDFMPEQTGTMLADSQAINFGTVAFRQGLGTPAAKPHVAVRPGTAVRLQWQAVDKAIQYAVSLCDEQGADCRTQKTSATNILIDPKDLPAGATRAWNVAADPQGDAKELSSGAIYTLNVDQEREFARSLQIIENRFPKGDPMHNPMLVSLYIAYGMSDKAAALLQKMSSQDPENISLKRMLENQIAKSGGAWAQLNQ